MIKQRVWSGLDHYIVKSASGACLVSKQEEVSRSWKPISYCYIQCNPQTLTALFIKHINAALHPQVLSYENNTPCVCCSALRLLEYPCFRKTHTIVMGFLEPIAKLLSYYSQNQISNTTIRNRQTHGNIMMINKTTTSWF